MWHQIFWAVVVVIGCLAVIAELSALLLRMWIVLSLELSNNTRWWQRQWFSLLFFTKTDQLDRISREVESRGRQAGFQVPVVTVIGVRSWLMASAQAKIYHDSVSATAFIWLRGPGGLLDESDIEIILAHEYGHLVYDHARRHPFSRRFRNLVEEDFADMVAAYLYSAEQNIRASKRHQLRFNYGLARRIELTRQVRIRQ